MSTSVLPPTAPTTLAIMLGASAWPNSPGFQASRAFVHAAQGFRNYLLDPRGFGLTTGDLLDQFDAQTSSSEQLELLSSFLEERTQALKTANQAARDVLVYFVGHGGFAGPSADFYLLLRRTNASSLRASGMAIDALAEVLREKARQMRRYLFLDCCFAAAAFRAFQGGPDQTAITKTLDAFAVRARSRGFPRKGTVLLCSSDQKTPALLLPDESCTMFSYALLDVLRNGDLHRPLQLSLRDLKELAEDRLAVLPEKNTPRPGLHSPDQSEGDVADIPFFPNPRAEEERRRRAEEAEQARLAREEHVRNIKEQTSPLLRPTFPPPTSPHAAVPPQPYSHLITRRNVLLLGLAGAGLTATGIGIGWWEFAHQLGTTLYTYTGHSSWVYAVAWSPDGKRIASGSDDHTVQVWDAADGSNVYPYKGHPSGVKAVAWSPDGKRIASGSWDDTVQVWNAADGSNVYTYRGHSSQYGVSSVAWSPDGKRIASGSEDGTVQVWNAADGSNVYPYKGHSDWVKAVAWSPDGKRIASGSWDDTVQVWNAADGSNVYTYKGHTRYLSAVAWSPDGSRIASASEDDTVQVWDAADGGNVYTYKGHTKYVRAVAWSPDGKRIASGSDDHTVQVWDAADGSNVYPYKGHPSGVRAVAWSPDGKRIASGSWDRTVQVWQAV